MPNNIVKSFAKKTGKSETEVETLWDRAVDIVNDEYKDIEKESDKFYQITTGILKNMLSLEGLEVEPNPILEDYMDLIKGALNNKKERINVKPVEKAKDKFNDPDVIDTNSNYNDGKVNLDSQFVSRLVKYIDSVFPNMTDVGGRIHMEIRKEIDTTDHKEHKKVSTKVRDTVYKEYMKFLDNVEKRVGKIITKPK